MQDARTAIATETYVKPSRAKVSDFFEAWLPYVRTTTEPTTAANYETLARAYVLPWIGQRPVQDIVPSVVAALYSHLLADGRRKRDTNWEMFQLWHGACAAKQEIKPRDLADKVGVTYAGARKAIQRYKAGRVPIELTPGLSAKTVKSVHIMLSSAMATAVAWKYLSVNPTESVKPPSVAKRTHHTWGPKELARFLEVARTDRFYGLWVLVASTGMRRSELCGLPLSAVDLDGRTVRMTATRVVAGGQVRKGSGKSPGSRRLMALDRFTTFVLREHVKRQGEERKPSAPATRTTGWCSAGKTAVRSTRTRSPSGSTVSSSARSSRGSGCTTSDTATPRSRSAPAYTPKIVSSRLGHSKVAFTLDTYSADIPDLDQQAAEDIGGLFLPPVLDE